MKIKKNKKIIILISALMILIIANLILSVFTKKEEVTIPETIEAKENELAISELSEKGELGRTEQYLSKFIGEIEDKNFDKAYDLLYDEFKDNYFETKSTFEEYCKKYFPELMDVQVDNIERINNIYVLETTINDLINGQIENGKISMYFVIRENNLNDFDLSFSMNRPMEAKFNK